MTKEELISKLTALGLKIDRRAFEMLETMDGANEDGSYPAGLGEGFLFGVRASLTNDAKAVNAYAIGVSLAALVCIEDEAERDIMIAFYLSQKSER